MKQIRIKPTTIAVRVDPEVAEVGGELMLEMVEHSARLSVEGELTYLQAYAPNPLSDSDSLGRLMVMVKDGAAAALSQHKEATCGLSFGMWDPPIGGLTTRFACAMMVDRFGNIYSGVYPDPAFWQVNKRKIAISRYMPAAYLKEKGGDQIGVARMLFGKDLRKPQDIRELPLYVAVASALRVYANPGPTTNESWPKPA